MADSANFDDVPTEVLEQSLKAPAQSSSEAPVVVAPVEPVTPPATPETPPATPPATVETPTVVPPAVTHAVPETPAVPAVDTSTWPENERLAHELSQRNPDIRPSEALKRADEIIAARSGSAAPEAPTTAARLAEIDTKLVDAGANEGLLTPEITNLLIERGNLAAQAAIETRDAEVASQVQAKTLADKRAESRGRVAGQYEGGETVNDPNSPIGKQISLVIEELQREKSSLLLGANAPEDIVALANSRLPLAERLKPKATVAETPTPGTPPVTPTVEPTPGLVLVPGILPVSGTERSAQPVVLSQAEARAAVMALPLDELEQAVMGNSVGGMLIRA